MTQVFIPSPSTQDPFRREPKARKADASIKIGRRSLRVFMQRLRDANNYRALLRFARVHRRPLNVLLDEVFSRGRYPRVIQIQTPIGRHDVELFSAADLSTLNLIFCREDYYTPRHAKTVVDIGSNIGLSAIYWLTRARDSILYCYEPSPISHARMMRNLSPFAERVVAHSVAVSDFNGMARLGLEESGVYSSLDLVSELYADCRVEHINNVLKVIIDRHGSIDILKIDSEGHELRTIRAIDRRLWPNIRCVNVDCQGAAQFIPSDFLRSRVSSAERFYRS